MIEKKLRINEQIRTQSVRLIDPEGKQIGIVSQREAMDKADEFGLDLVEISPDAKPPVCKIMDFGKFKYQKQMKERENKKKQHVVKIKEVRFRPRIGDHDLNMKVDHVREFLANGFKVKITLMFRGRELAHQEVGVELINKILEMLSDVCVVDKAPNFEGRSIVTILTAK
ncbi:MAG TPA: translation initiation factor IF-3 [Candidatus Marinimicrobia bacterium]|nr:translation initiation factor IF-3 [Candidatus Neomarinimicrobiota bacterium]